MADSPVVKIQYHWRDRDSNKAVTTMYLPFALTLAQVQTVADGWRSRANALSDAVIVRVTYTWETFHDNDPDTAGPRLFPYKALLFYRNVDYYECFVLPAPKASLFETVGNYAGIRVDMSNPTVASDIADLSTALEDTTTIEGYFWPDMYVVGGLCI
jgi:hypothetical protein